MASPGPDPKLPTEMIHRILSFLVARYIDDLIMDPLSLSASGMREGMDTPAQVSVSIFRRRLCLQC